ncbi:MAG: TonB family protein [Deltaproteobacteria bacterium]|nr:TonB family protein [Deltaproteobacteria bacterium]
MVDDHRWIAYAVLSVLLHGAIFFTLGTMKDAPKSDWFEVSLVSETSLGMTVHRSESGKPQADRHIRKENKRKDSASIHPQLSQSAKEPDTHKAEPFHPAGNSTAGDEQVLKQGEALTVGGIMGPPTPNADGKSKPTIAGQGNDPGLLARGAMGVGAGAGQNIGQGVVATSFGKPEAPRFLYRELPEYPLLARRRKLEGKVLLSVSLNDQGRLMGVEVVEASNQMFIGPSIEAVRRSRFAPATRNGVPVAAKALLPIRFTLHEETWQGIQGDHT